MGNQTVQSQDAFRARSACPCRKTQQGIKSPSTGSTPTIAGLWAVSDRSGDRFGDHVLVRLVGRGGMGEVYEAQHVLLHSRVAVKVLPIDLSQHAAYRERFLKEGMAGSRLQHPGLVRIYDYGVHSDGTPYLVMEFVEGPLLRQIVDEAPGHQLPVLQTLRIGWQVAEAMAAAHQRGLVHCDLKPENIKLAPESAAADGQRIKVLDFGIARVLDSAEPQTLQNIGNPGTPAYMSPERCLGERIVDGTADVYSLGCILYELFCGQTPFVGTREQVVLQHHYRRPPSVRTRRPDVPNRVSGLIDDMLAKRPTQRPTMAKAADALSMHVAQQLQSPAGSIWMRAKQQILGEAIPGARGAMVPTLPLPESNETATPGGLPVDRPQARYRWVLIALLGIVSIWYVLAHVLLYPNMVLVWGGAFWLPRDPAESGSQPGRASVSPYFYDRHEVTCAAFYAWLKQGIDDHLLTLTEQSDGTNRTLFVLRKGKAIANLYNPGTDEYSCGFTYENKTLSYNMKNADRSIGAVSWEGAALYCQQHGQRLPTEAEYDFARSNGGQSHYPWGDDEPRCGERVHFGSYPDPHNPSGPAACPPMPKSQPNTRAGQAQQDLSRDGISDLAGNQREWVQDCVEPYPPPACQRKLCKNPVSRRPGCEEHVAKGGSWGESATALQLGIRKSVGTHVKAQTLGFRCAANWTLWDGLKRAVQQ